MSWRPNSFGGDLRTGASFSKTSWVPSAFLVAGLGLRVRDGAHPERARGDEGHLRAVLRPLDALGVARRRVDVGAGRGRPPGEVVFPDVLRAVVGDRHRELLPDLAAVRDDD